MIIKITYEQVNDARSILFAASGSKPEIDRKSKSITFDLSLANEQEKAIIVAIYAKVEELKKAGKEIAINPPDKGFQSDAEIRREKIRAFSAEHPYRLFIRADNFENVMGHPLPDVAKTPDEHMRIYGTSQDEEKDSGYLSLFEVKDTETEAYKSTKGLPADYIHMLFVPKEVCEERSLTDVTVTKMPEKNGREPLLLETAGVSKLFKIIVHEDGVGEVIQDKSGERSIDIGSVTNLCLSSLLCCSI